MGREVNWQYQDVLAGAPAAVDTISRGFVDVFTAVSAAAGGTARRAGTTKHRTYNRIHLAENWDGEPFADLGECEERTPIDTLFFWV